MKPHIKPTTGQLKLNAALKRLPFYSGVGHFEGTKHSKAYSDYGYPLALDFWFYYSMYRRIGLARAAVKRPIDMCWLTPPKVKVNEDLEDEAFKDFAKRLKLWPKLRQVDDMQSVGHYAGIIVRVADGLTLDQPLQPTKMDKIVDLMPAWEGQLIPGNLDQDPSSPRYGMPVTFTYQQNGVRRSSQRDGTEQFTVHHSRVLIWNEGAVGNTVYGESCLEPIYNALMDWEKVRGAGAEGFWRKAAMRAVLQAAADTSGSTPSEEQLDQLTETITDMQDSFDAVPYLGGMELKGLGDSGSIAAIDKASQIALEDVAAGRGWSAKGLVGAQTGVLAGEQDTSIDKQTAQSRRENYLNMQLESMLQWLTVYTEYDGDSKIIEWDDLMSPSDDSRLALAERMAKVNKETMQEIYKPNEMRDISGFESLPELEDVIEDGGEGEDIETNAEGHKPPEGVQSAAKKGLELRDKYNRGGTAVGIARARDLSNGASVSTETINRMVSFFARHEKNRNPDKKESDGGPTNGWIAWQLWGGDAGKSWANKIADSLDD